MKRLALFLAFTLIGVPAVVSAQITDTSAPVLDAAQSGFTPAAIDVSGGPTTVTVNLFVTDDLSGVNFLSSPQFGPGVVFRSPSGAQVQRAFAFSLLSGDNLAGLWTADVTFPQGAESGTWNVESIVLQDNVGNTVFLDTALLGSLGFPTALDVTSIGDTTPPALVSFAIDTPTVDTSAGSAMATVTMELTDADSGVDFNFGAGFNFALGVFSPVGNFIRVCSVPTLVSGTTQAGTWTSSCYFPQYSQAGTWTIQSLSLHDVAGNTVSLSGSDLQAAGFPSSVDLTSTPSDTSPIQISTLDFAPTFIDTSSAPQTVNATASVTDDISGFAGIQMSFVSPSSGQQRLLFVSTQASGTPLDGTFTGSVVFPQFSEAGTWQIQSLFYYDQVFNYVQLDTAAMKARGFPTVLNVVLASLIGDGQIDSGGGTVTDSVYGNRAQITLPPGLVTQQTDVAIDVLASPLTFPMPIGFSAPGTRFVNISLTPTPAMPFAPPGVTVVLPLVDPMPAGTPLALYYVDQATGSLAAMASVNGGPVVGTVDPGGLSATFTGVSHFSVVVGLTPDSQPPVVTPPASITVLATEPLGTRGTVTPALTTFLAGGTAIDTEDPTPARLSPQVAGADVDSTSLFGLGITTVTFRFRDVAGNIGTATATVTVNAPNRPPVAGNDSYATDRDAALTIAAPGVLGNDNDPDLDLLVTVLDSGTTHGVLALSADGSFTYTPASGYTGPDSFTYRASDGQVTSNLATVSLTVRAVNTPPVCTAAVPVLSAPIFPLDHGMRGVSIGNVTDADGHAVTLKITQVCQDETPNGENLPAWAVDAAGINSTAAAVRSERSGTRLQPGNGRVYHIFFTADDGHGGSCSSEVKVGVPLIAGGVAGDGGALYNSVTGGSCAVTTAAH